MKYIFMIITILLLSYGCESKAHKERRLLEEKVQKEEQLFKMRLMKATVSLEQYIKKNMKDPDSYKHVETKYSKEGDYLKVMIKYRGKNSFGAIVTEIIIGKIDLNNKIVNIEKT